MTDVDDPGDDASDAWVRTVVSSHLKEIYAMDGLDLAPLTVDRRSVDFTRWRPRAAMPGGRLQVAIAAAAAVAVVAGGVGMGIRALGPQSESSATAAGRAPSTASRPGATVQGRGQASGPHGGRRLTIAAVARVTGYKVRPNPGMRSAIDAAGAMSRVPTAAYVVGPARLGLLVDTGVNGATKYHWRDVWVVVTKVTTAAQSSIVQGQRGSDSGGSAGSEPSEGVNLRTIAFVDAATGAVVRSVTP